MSSIISTNSVAAATDLADTQTQSEQAKDSLIENTDDFLTILLAQLKHQDPLDPMEGTEFIDSITRLSSVEQDINQNNNLEKILAALSSDNSTFGSPVSYLDRSVEFESQAFELKGGEAEFSYELDESPNEVFVTIQDVNGNVIRSTSEGGNDIGVNTIKWDGKDDTGNDVPEGAYFATVDFTLDGTNFTQVPTRSFGVVTGAFHEGDEVTLLIGDIKVKLEDVVSIKTVSTDDESESSDS